MEEGRRVSNRETREYKVRPRAHARKTRHGTRGGTRGGGRRTWFLYKSIFSPGCELEFSIEATWQIQDTHDDAHTVKQQSKQVRKDEGYILKRWGRREP